MNHKVHILQTIFGNNYDTKEIDLHTNGCSIGKYSIEV